MTEIGGLFQVPESLFGRPVALRTGSEADGATKFRKWEFFAPWETRKVTDTNSPTENERFLLCKCGAKCVCNTVSADVRSTLAITATGYPVQQHGRNGSFKQRSRIDCTVVGNDGGCSGSGCNINRTNDNSGVAPSGNRSMCPTFKAKRVLEVLNSNNTDEVS